MKNSRPRSQELFAAAQKVLPGGVNSPVRAFRAVGGEPFFVARAAGSKLYDLDGNEYIDYVGSWGALILGHAHPATTAALAEQLRAGTSYGACTELEVVLAQRICAALPSIEMVRFVLSGTEATMSAIRLARAFTRRDRILKFEGCYHGHADSFLSIAGSGLATLGVPAVPGVPGPLAELTLSAPFNDVAAVEKILAEHGSEIAAVIVEPVAANMGVVLPESDFLPYLRDITRRYGALLIFDEVITGFRMAYGGAQTLYGVVPDLTTLGKIIGGGLPVGAYGGRREIMELVAPVGPVYQAGTLAGNPLAMRAGLETLKQIERAGFYERLNQTAAQLVDGLSRIIRAEGLPVQVRAIGSLATVFFTPVRIRNYTDAQRADTRAYAHFFHGMLNRGVFLAPSQFEAMFVSAAHTSEDIEQTVVAFAETLRVVFSSPPAGRGTTPLC